MENYLKNFRIKKNNNNFIILKKVIEQGLKHKSLLLKNVKRYSRTLMKKPHWSFPQLVNPLDYTDVEYHLALDELKKSDNDSLLKAAASSMIEENTRNPNG